MAVDYIAHMSEGYLECDKYGKEDRVRHMLTEVCRPGPYIGHKYAVHSHTGP